MGARQEYINAKRGGSLLAIEGTWALRHAVRAKVVIDKVLVCPPLYRGDEAPQLVAQARADGAWVYEFGERVFRTLVERDGPDGVAALVRLPTWSLADLSVAPTTRVIVLDRMELAGNLGAVIRCADGAGAAAVVVTDRRVRVTHPLVVKSSMGTLFTVPVIDTTVDCVVAWARANDVRVIAADPGAGASYRGDHYRGPCTLVLGSERYGLAAEWRAAADVLVSIPMRGVADSLNVGHAAALLLYESLSTSL
jgi:TrmH family RNA methyltransferase